MHELGIVFHIQRELEAVAAENGVRRISSVVLELGEVSGVVPELLQDAWRWSADKKGLFYASELHIETLHAITHCEACGANYSTVAHGKTCPHCGSGATYLLCGSGIEIKEIEAGECARSGVPQGTRAPSPSDSTETPETPNPVFPRGEKTTPFPPVDAVAAANPLLID